MKPSAKIVLEFKEMSMALTIEEAKELYGILDQLVGEDKENHTHIHYDQQPWWNGPYKWTSNWKPLTNDGANWNVEYEPNHVILSYTSDLNDASINSNSAQSQQVERPDKLE